MGSRARRRVGVAVLLDEPAKSEVQGLRRALGDRSLSRIDPHLTLVSPLNLRDEDVPAALALLRRAAGAVARTIELTVGPVTTFAPANPVLYLEVGGDLDALRAVRREVHTRPLQRPAQWPWVPHITVAERVDPARVPEAVAVVEAFQLAVTVDRVVLLEFQDGKWGPLADVAFGPPGRVGTGGLALELSEGRVIDPEIGALLADAVPVEDLVILQALDRRFSGRSVSGRRPPIVIAARRGDTPCGVGVGWLDDDGGHIGVVVAPDVRGQGIGRHLVAAVESALSRSGWGCRTLEAHGPVGFYTAVSAWSRVSDSRA